MVAAVRRVRLRAQYHGCIGLGGKPPVSRRGASRPRARRGLHLLGNDHRRLEAADLSAHLQFRISDEGRYGVRLQAGTISSTGLCSEIASAATTPQSSRTVRCGRTGSDHHSRDDPIELPLGPLGYFDPALRTLKVTVVVEGSRFVVSFGTPSRISAVSRSMIPARHRPLRHLRARGDAALRRSFPRDRRYDRPDGDE